MFCRQCGRALKENAKFCPACGTPVQQAQKTAAPNGRGGFLL